MFYSRAIQNIWNTSCYSTSLHNEISSMNKLTFLSGCLYKKICCKIGRNGFKGLRNVVERRWTASNAVEHSQMPYNAVQHRKCHPTTSNTANAVQGRSTPMTAPRAGDGAQCCGDLKRETKRAKIVSQPTYVTNQNGHTLSAFTANLVIDAILALEIGGLLS